MKTTFPIYIIGAGLFGMVIAERLAFHGIECVIIEKSSHIGGNCASYIDEHTGIEIHRYGSHIFHTSDERVWNYINQFGSFNDYIHHVQINTGTQIYPLPISLATINSFFRKSFSPREAYDFITAKLPKLKSINNLEEKALSSVGKELYEAFIKGYTQKQWGKAPHLLPEEIINRLPVRFDYNTRYFSDKYEGIPTEGYDTLFQKMVADPLIKIHLDCDFFDIRKELAPGMIVFTGAIDEFFDYRFGRLEYRYVRFVYEKHDIADFQGNSVINYGSPEIPYTRIHEFKHYHPEKNYIPETVICKEFSCDHTQGGRMAYPVRTQKNLGIYRQYANLAQVNPQIIFGGRLGSYCYWDMDDTIDAALTCFNEKIMPQLQS